MKETSDGTILVGAENPLSLRSLNHISLGCRSVEVSIEFYQKVLGFIPIKRPGSFDFQGAWYGYIFMVYRSMLTRSRAKVKKRLTNDA